MHNSYRFLMMAATLILGVLLLSVFVFVFRAGAKSNIAVDDAQKERQLIASNSRFEKYNRVDNTISDIITLISLVYNYNKENNFWETDCIDLEILLPDGRKVTMNYDTCKDLNDYYKGDETKIKKSVVSINGIINDPPVTIYDLMDSFSETKYDKDSTKTVYKYLFTANEFDYDLNTGKVNKIKLSYYLNDLF